jgi:hypothetical protein
MGCAAGTAPPSTSAGITVGGTIVAGFTGATKLFFLKLYTSEYVDLHAPSVSAAMAETPTMKEVELKDMSAV